MKLTPSMRIPAIKTAMKSIESGVWASILGWCMWTWIPAILECPGVHRAILSGMVLYMRNHIPTPIQVTWMGGGYIPPPIPTRDRLSATGSECIRQDRHRGHGRAGTARLEFGGGCEVGDVLGCPLNTEMGGLLKTPSERFGMAWRTCFRPFQAISG